MKTYCFECKHDCHCGGKCDQCSCYICNNIVIKTYEDYMRENNEENKQEKKSCCKTIETFQTKSGKE